MSQAMAGTSPLPNVPRSVFAVKLINDEFVVEYSEDKDDGNTERLMNYLQKFRSVLDEIKAHGYDRDIIRQLMEVQTRLVIYEPKKRIQELENAIVPLQHRLEALEFSLGKNSSTETHHRPSPKNLGTSFL